MAQSLVVALALVSSAPGQTLTETNAPAVSLPAPAPLPPPPEKPVEKEKPVAPPTPAPPLPGSLLVTELEGFAQNSVAVQQLLTAALDLSGKGLVYKMGSAKPENGGMDCSGTMYYLLRSVGLTAVPRQSDEQYRWAWQAGTFIAVNGVEARTFEFAKLRPGCLLFWTGTYDVGKRNPPISHVMIYLGKRATDGKELMFGASDGRLSGGKPSWGVGVFDFRLPTAKGTSRFIGYAPIPGLSYDDAPSANAASK